MKAWWIVVVVLLSGCSNVSNPVAPQPSAKAHPYAPEDWTPMLQRLDVRIAGPHLMIQGLLDERAPVPFNGGWSLQALLDTDQNRATGYTAGQLGAEFVVRGPERQPDGSLLVRIADDRHGWMEEIGTARFVENGRAFTVAVPLSLIEDEGALDWQVATHYGQDFGLWRGSCAPRPFSGRSATLIR